MLYDPNNSDRPYLIDLDFAVNIEEASSSDVDPSSDSYELETPSEVAKYSFALPFLALDHLPIMARAEDIPYYHIWSDRQIYRHDLESFVWTIWWSIAGAHPKKGAKDLKRVCGKWSSANLVDCHNAKFRFLTEMPELRQELVRVSDRLWKNPTHQKMMTKFMEDMSYLVGQGYKKMQMQKRERTLSFHTYETACGMITLESILNVFPEGLAERLGLPPQECLIDASHIILLHPYLAVCHRIYIVHFGSA